MLGHALWKGAHGRFQREVFADIARYAAARRAGDAERRHAPEAGYAEQVEQFRIALKDEGQAGDAVIRELIALAELGSRR